MACDTFSHANGEELRARIDNRWIKEIVPSRSWRLDKLATAILHWRPALISAVRWKI